MRRRSACASPVLSSVSSLSREFASGQLRSVGKRTLKFLHGDFPQAFWLSNFRRLSEALAHAGHRRRSRRGMHGANHGDHDDDQHDNNVATKTPRSMLNSGRQWAAPETGLPLRGHNLICFEQRQNNARIFQSGFATPVIRGYADRSAISATPSFRLHSLTFRLCNSLQSLRRRTTPEKLWRRQNQFPPRSETR